MMCPDVGLVSFQLQSFCTKNSDRAGWIHWKVSLVDYIQRAFVVPCRTFVFQGVMSGSQAGSERRCPRWSTVDWEVWLKLAELHSAEKVILMPAACHMLRPGRTWRWQGRGGRAGAKSGLLNGVSTVSLEGIDPGRRRMYVCVLYVWAVG